MTEDLRFPGQGTIKAFSYSYRTVSRPSGPPEPASDHKNPLFLIIQLYTGENRKERIRLAADALFVFLYFSPSPARVPAA